jgi:hypothetical protein
MLVIPGALRTLRWSRLGRYRLDNLKRAVWNRLHCIFVDTGLLRLGEASQVVGNL